MNGKTVERIRLISSIAVSVLSLGVGVAFITQILRIYSLGGKPYNAQIISEYFAQIAPLVWVWLALTLALGVFSVLFPKQEKKATFKDGKLALARLKSKLPMQGENFSEDYTKSVQSLAVKEMYRKTAWIACALVCAASAVLMIIYLSNAENFLGEDVTQEVKNMVFAFLPYLVGCFICVMGVFVYEKVSVRKETDEVKALFKESVKAGYEKEEKLTETKWQLFVAKIEKALTSKKGLLITRSIVFAACVCLIVVGVLNGGLEAVLGKAIRICQECIGLG